MRLACLQAEHGRPLSHLVLRRVQGSQASSTGSDMFGELKAWVSEPVDSLYDAPSINLLRNITVEFNATIDATSSS